MTRKKVADLTPEEYEAQKAQDRKWKRQQRANAKGMTLEEYDAHIAARAAKAQLPRWEQMTQEQQQQMVSYTQRRRKEAIANGTALWSKDAWNLVLSSTRRYCKKKGLPFDIDATYLVSITPATCPVLGIPLVRGGKGVSQPNSPSIDRLIPERGYVRGNIIIVSRLANQVRSNATPDQILKVGSFYRALFQRFNEMGTVDMDALI